MKYQNFAVIFILIVLPLSVLLSYYIQNQTDTLALQNKYQTKLNDSTYDAITAFQMNSLNTQRVSGESVKSYVLASVNTFFTTLATNLGMSSASKQNLLPYVPAILFTTYDGYYIYSPVKTYTVLTDENTGVAKTDDNHNVLFKTRNNNNNDNGIPLIDGDGKDTDISSVANLEYSYMLKPFIYYSAKYFDNNYNFVASYTLDNYLTVYGQIKNSISSDNALEGIDNDGNQNIEFSKSGYLIDPNKITITGDILIKTVARGGLEDISLTDPSETKLDDNSDTNSIYANIIKVNQKSDLSSYDNVRYKTIDINSNDAYKYINYYNSGKSDNWSKNGNNNKYYMYTRKPTGTNTNEYDELRCQTGDEIIESTIDIERDLNNEIISNDDIKNFLTLENSYTPLTVNYNGIQIDDLDAKEYYVKAYFFSKWVQNNLSSVTAKTIKMDEQTGDEYIDFTDDGTKIFDMTNNDPELKDSAYTQHKQAVIRNSIQFNLNTAISTYNENYYGDKVNPFQLPIITSKDWESILNNVSMATFLQGLPCGLTTFNNYCVIKSNNNNTTVSLENLYFTEKIDDENTNYHKYNCHKLIENNLDLYESDLSAEFKYDAKKINSIVSKDTEKIICFYDDSTNTYYAKKKIDVNGGWNEENITIGDVITLEEAGHYSDPASGNEYNLFSERDVMNGSKVYYLYDHKNLGCYECIISNNYTPTTKFINGKIYRAFTVDDDDSLIIEIDDNNTKEYIREDGTVYTGSQRPNEDNSITLEQLNSIRKSVYTAFAKHRNNLYKTNDYVNR